MKVRFTKLTNINGEWYNIGDEEEFADSVAGTLIAGEHAIEAKPEKRIPEAAVRKATENALKTERTSTVIKIPTLPKKPAKKSKPRK